MDAEQREHERAMDEAAGVVRPIGDVLDDVVGFLRRYIVMSDDQATCLALWIAHTHAIEAADTTPYVHVTAPTMRSGKTRVLEVAETVVANPLTAANATQPALLRSMANRTLLYDEVDAVFGPKANERHEDTRALLNSGYRRGVPALRCVGQGSNQEVVAFEVFAAKMLSGIGALPGTLADRSLPIRLKRRTRGEQIDRWRQSDPPADALMLHNELSAWASEQLETLRHARPELPEALDDRAQDAYEPLLAIADLAGGDWPERARRALVALRNEHSEDEEIAVRLLTDIARAFDNAQADRLSTRALIDKVCDDEEGPWTTWHRDGRRLSPRALGRLLSGFGIHSRTIRFSETETAKGYLREQFDDAWRRYPPDSRSATVTSVTTASTSQNRSELHPSHDALVTDGNQGRKAHEHNDVTDVTDARQKREGGKPFGLIPDGDARAENVAGVSPACQVAGHHATWTARDRRRRCFICDPPVFPGEIIETHGVVL